MMLTLSPVLSNNVPVVAKSTAGIDLLNKQERTSAHSKRFFSCKFIYGGLCGSVFGCAVLLFGKVNPAQPATFLIDLNGGSSRTKQELVPQ